jgi:hypothetical protein
MNKNRLMYRERECLHRDMDVEGDFYNGSIYVKALQRLDTDSAMKMAQKVTPFFWSDAAHILVWLCHSCAGDLRLSESSSVPLFKARVG